MSRRDYPKQLEIADRHLGRTDPLMRRLVRAHGPCGLEPAWKRSPYEALVRAVIYQQLTGHVAGKIMERFVDLFDAAGTREGVNAFLEKRDPQWRNK